MNSRNVKIVKHIGNRYGCPTNELGRDRQQLGERQHEWI